MQPEGSKVKMDNPFEALGLDSATLLAGFVGGVASLSFISNLTPLKAFTAIVGGAFCAGYSTGPVAEYAGLSEGVENGLAFLIGIVGMNIVGGLFKLSTRFSNAPLQTIRDVKDLKGDGEDA